MWPFNKKEIKQEQRSEPQNLQLTYEQQLAHNSYCEVVQQESNFIKALRLANEYDPMSLSAVFAAVNLISNSLAQMPFCLKENNEIIEYNYLKKLTEQTNLTPFLLTKNLIKDMLIYGDGFAYIQRDKNGNPTSLQYLEHGQCSAQYNSQTDVLYYLAPKVKRGRIEPVNIIHFVMHTKDGINGKSVLDFARNVIKLSGYTEAATKEYFKNGMSVQGIIKSAGPRLTEQQRNDIRNNWKNANGDVRVLEGGLDYQTVQSNGKEAELTQNRTFNVIEIARYFNINPILLGDLSHTQYASIEMAQTEFVLHTLAPYVIMMENECNKKLFVINQNLYIDIDEEAIITPDKQSLVNMYSSLADKGIITRNEARVKLGFAPIKDELADKLVLTYKDQKDEETVEEKEEQNIE